MEDATYHFESENINLVDPDVNNEDCTSFVYDHGESDPDQNIAKRLLLKNEFQTINYNFIEVTSSQELNTRTNEIEEELTAIITSPTESNQNLTHDRNESEKQFDDSCTILESNTFKESQSLLEVKSEPDSHYRGGVQLVRLQVASEPEQTTKVRSDVEAHKSNADSITSAIPQGKLFGHKLQEVAENPPLAYSEQECQFLTPRLQTLPQQVFVSPNSEESFGFEDTDFKTLMQSENMSNATTSITSCSSNVVNRLQSSSIASIPSSAIKRPMWIANSSSNTTNTINDSVQLSTTSSLEYMHELPEGVSSDHQSSTIDSETPDPQQMQRFYTADNQVVYGYKDSQGEFHFFCPALSNRESHNEKERKRRSRVSEACCTLRNMVPGLSDKTDKATVFEQAAAYLKFLREKFSSQFDQSYCEKYFQERD